MLNCFYSIYIIDLFTLFFFCVQLFLCKSMCSVSHDRRHKGDRLTISVESICRVKNTAKNLLGTGEYRNYCSIWEELLRYCYPHYDSRHHYYYNAVWRKLILGLLINTTTTTTTKQQQTHISHRLLGIWAWICKHRHIQKLLLQCIIVKGAIEVKVLKLSRKVCSTDESKLCTEK